MIQKVSTPLEEQETIINITPPQVEERVNVYTTMTTQLNKLWKLHEKYPDDILVVTDDKYGSEFSLPRNWIKISRPRQMTEEQKKAAGERLNAVRNL